jgi:arylsulfatase A-like enzyme
MARSLLALLLTLVGALTAAAAEPRKPNVVIVLADDLGYADVGCYGGKIATPHIDRLAADGLRFSDAHTSSSVCSPTRYGLLTGRYNWRSKLKSGVLGGLSPRLIEPERMTIGSLLQLHGYHTACVGKWHLGMDWAVKEGLAVAELNIEPREQVFNVDYAQPIAKGPNSVGFDWYCGISASLDMVPYTFIENDRVAALPTEDRSFAMMHGRDGGTTRKGPAAPDFDAADVLPTLARKSVQYIDQRAEAARAGKPFMLYVPLASPHTPILPTEKWQGRSGINPYADFVMQTDDAIGAILAALDRHELTDNTLVIVTSDNGCSPQAKFDELSAHGHEPSGPLRGHKADLFEGGHRVPFIVRWPGVVAAGKQSAQLLCLTDVLATLAEIVGAKLPENAGEDSISFLPVLRGEAGSARDHLVSHSINGSFAIRRGPWKLMLCSDSGGWSAPRPRTPQAAALPAMQLYDLSADLGEQHNAIDQQPEKAAELTKLLETVAAEGRSTPGKPQPNTGPVDVYAHARKTAQRPNVLWITSEDNSPYLGCYGDPLAQTPHLDRLAAEGLRYRRAFANAPVCSSARTTLITGMYATSLGAHHHRSRVMIPERFKLYPEHLRKAGYYCTNNSKTDYNLANARQPWDESSNKAHYRNRAAGQPFFAVFNFTTSHESQVAPKPSKTAFRVAPEKILLPPFHPDTPEIRRDWANYYDQMTLLDTQVGRVLAELDEAGLADDTIVFYYGDHGGALPRGKRNIHDSGTRVPLIVRIPPKWAHLAPAKPGEWVEQPVSFVDLPATLLSLCGVPVPRHYEGRPFLGDRQAPPRQHVFLYRGRMDERYDTVRAVRDAQFRYVRNYTPHRPWGQHYSYPFQVQPSMRSWFAEFEAGRCNPVQAAYWQPKPTEELYDTAADPFEIDNLTGKPEQAARLAAMRQTLRAEMIATRDTGFIPEAMFARLAGNRTIYDYAQSDEYPIERIIDLAEKASSRNVALLPDLMAALGDPHPVVRYWGAVGCVVLQGQAEPAKAKLLALQGDDWADVRIAAAEALSALGESDAAMAMLAETLSKGELYESLAALNALEYIWKAGHVDLPRAQSLVAALELAEPANRITKYLRESK